ncbi:hypothetical protein RUND412_011032 [Rhizina undulata]
MFGSIISGSQILRFIVIKDKLDKLEKMNDDFIEWKDSPSSSTLWLHGIAGAGKTTLASLVIDESIESKNDAVAYFYCKHGERDRQDPASILSTIVKQLSLMGPAEFLPQSVVSTFKAQKPKSGTMQLSESRKLIANLAENFVQTIIVIDALDECDKESRKDLLAALDIILNSSNGVIKLFVTSRDADDIALKLENVPKIYITSSDNTADIAAFVRAEVDKRILDKSLLRGEVTSEVKESIIEKLNYGANGIFHLNGNQVFVGYFTNQEHMRGKNSGDDRGLIAAPTGNLERHVLGNMGKMYGQIAHNRTLAEKTLKWIMCAQSPLAVAEILQALSVEPMDFTGKKARRDLQVQHLLDVCQNLIVMDEQLGVLRTAHFSVDEFLEDHFKIAEAHKQAAEVCLTMMRRPKIYENPPMSSVFNGGINFFDRHRNLTPRPEVYHEPNPLRYYMFDHWAYHVRFSGAASNSLLELQKDFFNASPAYCAWLKAAEERWELFRPMQRKNKLTPLWVASYYQLSDICKTLLSANVNDYNIRNVYETTPLFLAANFGNEEVVKLLVEKGGVDINSKNESGETPLFAAARWGHEAVVELLLKRKDVDINSKNYFGNTP